MDFETRFRSALYSVLIQVFTVPEIFLDIYYGNTLIDREIARIDSEIKTIAEYAKIIIEQELGSQ